jgi:5-methylcytosine-specific restriction endonuclease McrA
MGTGWEDPSAEQWQAPIPEPKATSWRGLIRRLGESGPREIRASDLRRQQKTKVRQRDEYQCRRPGCSSGFDLSSPPGECWLEAGRPNQRPRNQSRNDFIGQCLHIHHIVKIENGGRNVPSNLITLCEPCHVKLHNQRGERVPEWEQFLGYSGSDQDFLGL